MRTSSGAETVFGTFDLLTQHDILPGDDDAQAFYGPGNLPAICRRYLDAPLGDTHLDQAWFRQMNVERGADVTHHIIIRIDRERTRLVVHNVEISLPAQQMNIAALAGEIYIQQTVRIQDHR